jgi:hypothetical protein
MGSERTNEPGPAVYLLAELRADGRIHEIGTRGTVLDVGESAVVLELSGAPSPVSCPANDVEPAAERRTRARRAARGGAWLRPVAS